MLRSKSTGAGRAAWEGFKQTIIWRLLRQQRMWFLWLALALGVTGSAGFGILNTVKDFFDNLSSAHPKPSASLIGNLRFLAVVAGIGALVAGQLTARILYDIEYRLRLWLYRHLQSADPGALDGLSSGQLVTRAVTDLGFLETLTLVLPGVIGLVLLGLVVLGLLFAINVPMTLVVLAAVPVNIVVARRAVDRLRGLSWVWLDRRARVTTAVDEAVRGIRVVKAFGQEETERSRVSSLALSAYEVAMARVLLLARFTLVLRAVPVLLSAVLVAGLGWFAVHDHLTVGQYVIFLPIGSGIILGTGFFDDLVSGWQLARVGSGRIFEMVEAAEAATHPPIPADLPELDQSGLVVADVSVSTTDGRVLGPVDLAVLPGQLVVVRGRGDEVSALAEAATARRQPLTGSILIGGHLAEALPAPARRDLVMLVAEEPFLFGRTLRENLLLGLPEGQEADDARLVAALDLAGASEVVEALGAGLDSPLSDRGLALSGGQRQRVALARALVRPPHILVLDDALSAVHPSLRDGILQQVRVAAPALAILYLTRTTAGTGVADAVIDLASARLVVDHPSAAAQASGAPAVNVSEPPRFEAPSDELVAESVARLAEHRESAPVGEAAATASDRPPTIPNLLRPLWKGLLATIGALMLVTFLGLVPNGLNKLVIDGIHHHQTGPAYRVALILAGLALVVGMGQYWLRIYTTRVSQGVLYLLRRRLFQRLTRLGLDYYDSQSPGEVAARVVYDLDTIEQFVENNLYNLVVQISLMVAVMGVFLVWNRSVFLAVAVYIPVILLASLAAVPMAADAYRRTRSALGQVLSRFHEDFLGRRVLSGHGSSDRAFAAFAEAAMGLRRARARAAWISNSYNGGITILSNLALAGLLATAGHLTSLQRLSLGSTGALAGYLQAAIAPLPALFGILQAYLLTRASFRTLSQPFEAPIHPPESIAAVPCAQLAGHIGIHGVSFRYPGTTRWVIQDLDLEIRPGEILAVVGRTGAGKSSVAKLIGRLYDPECGSISLDGVDLRGYELGSYRRRLGVVPQEAFCFRGSLRDNLRLGRPEASDSELTELLLEAGAAELLGLPGGLDCFIDEEGVNLSPSQRQFIAISRMWLHQPDVLILDEATSALDAEAETRLVEGLRRRQRTTVVVTHHLSLARGADRTAVLDEGRLLDIGTHAELVARCPVYTDLWNPQELAVPSPKLKRRALVP